MYNFYENLNLLSQASVGMTSVALATGEFKIDLLNKHIKAKGLERENLSWHSHPILDFSSLYDKIKIILYFKINFFDKNMEQIYMW